MKLPDITLIFQMIHFLIAYMILKRFVFTPSLMILEANEARNQRYNQRIHEARMQFNGFVEQQHQRWHFIRQSLMEMSPVVGIKKCFTGFKVSSPVEVEKTKLTVQEQENLKKVLHKKLLDLP
jgi:hypothetical protein